MSQTKATVGNHVGAVRTEIDRRKCKRVVPMKVLCLGLSRTGTSSLREALFQLGYHDVYHMASAVNENPKDCEMWLDAYKALKDGQGEFGREQWDQLLGHCMAVTDQPCSCFAAELIAAYPEALVILTVRDSAEAWYKSNLQTIYYWGNRWWGKNHGILFRLYQWLQGPKSIRSQMGSRCWHAAGFGDFLNTGKKFYDEHNEMVKRIVPQNKLLVYNVKEGWEPLCGFLGKEVPESKFPKINDTEEFHRHAAFGDQMLKKQAVRNGVRLALGAGVTVAAIAVMVKRLKIF